MTTAQPQTIRSTFPVVNAPTRWLRGPLVALGLLIASAVPSPATTYVMVADEALADQALVIAQVEIRAIAAGPADEAPATDYIAQVSEVIKGYLPASTIVARVPGGLRADGLALRIAGAPEFELGERVVLFLEAGADGIYRPLHLMLGAFHVRESASGEIALRDLSGARQIHRSGSENLAEESPRDLEKFVAWLADRAAGDVRPADYDLPAKSLSLLKYSMLTPADGIPVRWFNGATWRVHQAGQPGLTPGETAARFTTALESWNEEPNSDISLSYGGLTSATRGFGGGDGTNSVTFNDPSGQVAGSYSCSQGGVVAMGGPYFYGSTRSYRGQQYHEAFEADIVTNDGSECFFRNNPRATEEVLAHELGHTLGFGHSAAPEALMWPWGHDDQRGVRFATDDREAAAVVYGDGTVQAPPPGPPADQTVAPIRLTPKVRSSSQVLLKWTHSVKRLSEIRVDIQEAGGDFVEIAVLRAGVKNTTARSLARGTTYGFRVRGLLDGELVALSAVSVVTMSR
jgi:Matrixin